MPTFPDDFPFHKRTPAAPAAAPADAAPTLPELLTLAAAPTLQIPARERRRSPRQTLVARATLRAEAGPTGLSAGYVSNISMLGVGFHTRKPLAIGDKYEIRLEVGPMKWSSRVRVISCAAHPTGTFDVGGEFVGNELSQRARAVAA